MWRTPTKSMPHDNIAEKLSMPAFDPMKQRSSGNLRWALSREWFSQFRPRHVTWPWAPTSSCNKSQARIVLSRFPVEHTITPTVWRRTRWPSLQSSSRHSFTILITVEWLSNQQLTKEHNRLAIRYEGKSVAEQNSIDLAFWSLGISILHRLGILHMLWRGGVCPFQTACHHISSKVMAVAHLFTRIVSAESY